MSETKRKIARKLERERKEGPLEPKIQSKIDVIHNNTEIMGILKGWGGGRERNVSDGSLTGQKMEM